jgi:hypothetical protein
VERGEESDEGERWWRGKGGSERKAWKGEKRRGRGKVGRNDEGDEEIESEGVEKVNDARW